MKLISRIFTLMVVVVGFTACSNKKDDMGSGGVHGSYESFQSYVGEDRVMFSFDSSRVSNRYAKVLDTVVEWLKMNPAVDMLIEGYCDKRGTREYNLALGERRANAVRDYLLSKGVESDRIRIISYGKEKLLFQGDSETIHAKNRVGVCIPQ